MRCANKDPSQPNRCLGGPQSLIGFFPLLSDWLEYPQRQECLFLSPPKKPFWWSELSQQSTFKFNVIFSHSVSWNHSLDNHFRSSCLHRWVSSSPLSPPLTSIAVLSCAEWCWPTLCGSWEISLHGRVSRLICVSHSLHAPLLPSSFCLPLTLVVYASVHRHCGVHFQLWFWWQSYAQVWFFWFLKGTLWPKTMFLTAMVLIYFKKSWRKLIV